MKPDIAGRHSIQIMNLQQGLKLAISLVLFYWFALTVNWDLPNYGALAIVLVSLSTRGATLDKAIARVIGTTFGVAAGVLLLALFHQDRWLVMATLTAYLVVAGYFIQSSRYTYAWFVAGFMPLVIWADNYPSYDNTFYFTVFRWLETTVGILIYTFVDMFLWPRRAGDQLVSHGSQIWTQTRQVFDIYRDHLVRRHRLSKPEDHKASELRISLSGLRAKASTSLHQAFTDTPAIRSKKTLWLQWERSTGNLLNALELFRESMEACDRFDLSSLTSQWDSAVDQIALRLERIESRWPTSNTELNDGVLDKEAERDLSDKTSIEIEQSTESLENLASEARAAYFCFESHLRALDHACRKVLASLDHIHAKATADCDLTETLEPNSDNSSIESGYRWLCALLPAIAFVLAFQFWILANPPTGPKIPMFAGILSLMILMTPINPAPLVALLMMSTFFAVAPVYWGLMPRLEGGLELLAFVFFYSLLFGYLGGSRPALKSGPMVMFVNMVGISNQQHFSFQGPVDAALMLIISAMFVTAPFLLFRPILAEQSLVPWLKRFFGGCQVVTSALPSIGQGQPTQRPDKYYQSVVMLAPSKIAAAGKRLDVDLTRNQSADDLRKLSDGVQSIAYRLESLIRMSLRIENNRVPGFVASTLHPIGDHLSSLLSDAFGGWKEQNFHPFDQLKSSLESVGHQMESVLTEWWQDSRKNDRDDREVLVQVYSILGGVRGLVDAMDSTRDVMNDIDWDELTQPRF